MAVGPYSEQVFVTLTVGPDDKLHELHKVDVLLAKFLAQHFHWVRTTRLSRVEFELFPLRDPMKAMG